MRNLCSAVDLIWFFTSLMNLSLH